MTEYCLSDGVPEAVTGWLDSLGVLCDCDNGLRSFPWGTNATVTEMCDRCVLVKVGGIRVRILADRPDGEGIRLSYPIVPKRVGTLSEAGKLTHFMLPAVEVTDDE